MRVSWYELGRVYRRLEARGEIRGGRFVNGASGEQFALPEAIGLLRAIRKASAKGELIVINAADPLNLIGILTPGARIPSITANRILLRDGLPIAALVAGEVRPLNLGHMKPMAALVSQLLTIGKMAPALRPYLRLTAVSSTEPRVGCMSAHRGSLAMPDRGARFFSEPALKNNFQRQFFLQNAMVVCTRTGTPF